MLLSERGVFALVVALLNLPPTVFASDLKTTYITKDVCILGGGSADTYAAIRLLDAGKSIALIEKEPQIGGNVNTYVDPTTDQTFDNGVIVYDNIPVVANYVKSLGVTLAPLPSSAGGGLYADFNNGSALSAADLFTGNATAASLKYQKLLDKFPYLVNGYDLPRPVPADLLLSWGEFIK